MYIDGEVVVVNEAAPTSPEVDLAKARTACEAAHSLKKSSPVKTHLNIASPNRIWMAV
jgi:hypothetical protein